MQVDHPETQESVDMDSIQVFVTGLGDGKIFSIEVLRSTSISDLLSLLVIHQHESYPSLAKESVVTVASRSIPTYMLLSDLNIVTGTVIDVSLNVLGGKHKLRTNPRYGNEMLQTKMFRFEKFMRKPHQRGLIRSLLTRNIGVKICRKCYRRNPYPNKTCRSRACGHSNIFRPKSSRILSSGQSGPGILEAASRNIKRAFRHRCELILPLG